MRYERDRVVNGTPAVEVTVVNGPSYWSSDPVHGVHSNAGDPQRFRHHPARSVALLLDPAELLALLRLEAQGPTEVAGRACHQLVGVVHPLVIEPISSLPIHVGADDVVVDVDIERGVVLRLESRVAGEAFDVIELGRVAFDEPIDEERFTPDPPPGSVPSSLVSSPAPIGEVARRAPFVVLSPTRPPEGTGAIVAHYREAGSERRPRVSIRLSPEVRTAGASWFVNVEQAADDGDMPHVDSWEPVEIADGPAFVWEGERGRARRCHVRLERAGTHVWLQADMPRTVLLDVASSLEPVPAA
jgi:hypothetical protein